MSLVKDTIDGLKKKLELTDQYIYLQDRHGNVDRYNCEFNRPASNEEIEGLLASTALAIPSDYLDFLKQTNGCSLFNHEIYGGENLLFPIDQVEFLYNHEQKGNGYLHVATIFDDNIVIDCNAYKKGDGNHLLAGSSTSSFGDLKKLGCNFETWLYRFIITNGSKYWIW